MANIPKYVIVTYCLCDPHNHILRNMWPTSSWKYTIIHVNLVVWADITQLFEIRLTIESYREKVLLTLVLKEDEHCYKYRKRRRGRYSTLMECGRINFWGFYLKVCSLWSPSPHFQSIIQFSCHREFCRAKGRSPWSLFFAPFVKS